MGIQLFFLTEMIQEASFLTGSLQASCSGYCGIWLDSSPATCIKARELTFQHHLYVMDTKGMMLFGIFFCHI